MQIYNSEKLIDSDEKLSIIIEEDRFIVKLEQGSSFGEMALIKNEQRNVNIKAEEKCQLVSIDKGEYRKIIKDIEEKKVMQQLKSFKVRYPFFREWQSNKCISLISGFRYEAYNNEDYAYKKNSIPNYIIYIIKSGVFEVTSDIIFSGMKNLLNLYMILLTLYLIGSMTLLNGKKIKFTKKQQK